MAGRLKARLVLVGPEAGQLAGWPDSQVVSASTYHEFAQSEHYSEPDLVVAFNCGFILYTSWIQSIPHMLRPSGAPLLFTEYYLQVSLLSGHQTCSYPT